MQNQAKPRSTKALRVFKGLPRDNEIHKRHATSKCQVYQKHV